MYCPNCSNQNIDNAKFCRSCGGDLETVSLAMNNRMAAPSYGPDWVELYGEAKSKVASSAILFGSALLIWLVPAFMVHDVIGWTAIWSVFFGWLAVWGIFAMAANVGKLVKAKTMLKSTDYFDKDMAFAQQLLQSRQPQQYQQIQTPQAGQLSPQPLFSSPQSTEPRHDTNKLTSPPSVTEGTTRFLDQK
jgi:zinc-ribbon domain